MTEQRPRPLSYDEAKRIRREATELDAQLARIVVQARSDHSAAEIARDLFLTEGRIHQILRKARQEAEQS